MSRCDRKTLMRKAGLLVQHRRTHKYMYLIEYELLVVDTHIRSTKIEKDEGSFPSSVQLFVAIILRCSVFDDVLMPSNKFA